MFFAEDRSSELSPLEAGSVQRQRHLVPFSCSSRTRHKEGERPRRAHPELRRRRRRRRRALSFQSFLCSEAKARWSARFPAVDSATDIDYSEWKRGFPKAAAALGLLAAAVGAAGVAGAVGGACPPFSAGCSKALASVWKVCLADVHMSPSSLYHFEKLCRTW